MSKLKIGLSAFFMLIFLGMFGGLVSAAGFDPTNLQHPTSTLNNATIDNTGTTNSQRTHGNFQNNTNSCSNCHSVHNGETDTLLMKSGASELCMSCHDGTLGFYDVTTASEAGIMFSQDQSASMHQVESHLNENAAPGSTGTVNTTNGATLKNTSTATFECSSCHNPHGSANDRLLNEKVAGNQYGSTYNVSIVGYAETITKTSTIPLGTKAIKLNLQLDPAYSAINTATNLSGLKIYKSKGIYAETDLPKNPDGSLGTVTAVDGSTVGQADVRNYRLNYSALCGSCHTDYYRSREAGSRSMLADDGAHLYTHSTSSTKQGRSCTSCHYAHGTDITLLRDTSGKTIADLEKPLDQGGKAWSDELARQYMKDVTKEGSTLKRFTNYSICWTCHTSTATIPNTAGTNGYPVGVPGGDYSGKALIK
ncbi:cytochrome c3 family protein [Neobacillus sp. PS3-12]|uniref:cytochrome c3 family protein n=1 Tax=Neobacillus sp. PS3-12 TaxID=3070677 RepID=UPI0027E1A731|nr:cytochrome c3 family protein [Neobacillus sp. PS3-12]WML54728.1 cytochrome c3 family protein [Neobacillus sp. PS3-12]